MQRKKAYKIVCLACGVAILAVVAHLFLPTDAAVRADRGNPDEPTGEDTSVRHGAGRSCINRLVVAVAAATGSGDDVRVQTLLGKVREAGVSSDDVSAEGRAALLESVFASRVRWTLLREVVRLAVRAGVTEGVICQRAQSLLGEEVTIGRGLRLLSALPFEDSRIDDAIARVLLANLDAPSRRTEVAQLGLLRRHRATPLVIEAIRSDLARGARKLPFVTLQRMGPPGAPLAPELQAIAAERDGEQWDRAEALTTLIAILGSEASETIVAGLIADAAPAVRQTAMTALEHGRLPDQSVVESLQAGLNDPNEEVRGAAFRTLLRWSSDLRGGVEHALASELEKQWERARAGGTPGEVLLFQACCTALATYPSPSGRIAEVVRTAANAADPDVRWRAAFAHWRATGDIELAATAMAASLSQMFMMTEAVIPALAEMAYGANRKDSTGAPFVRRALAANPGAVKVIERYRVHPKHRRDARLLLDLVSG